MPKNNSEREILSLIKVSKTYLLDGVEINAVVDASLQVRSGELIAIIGPSGSGKSTLMHIMGLLDKQSSGKIFVKGKDVSDLGEEETARLRSEFVGFVFQQFNLLPKTSALENVLLPTLYSREVPDSHRKAIALLEDLGMGDRLKNYPNQLSGGQQQRVAIARSLINDPAIIFADEPTGNLDSKSGREVIEILVKLNRKGKTVVIVTHDPKIARIARRVITMFDGKITKDRVVRK